MSIIRWPDTLPTPSGPGFGLTSVDPSVRTPMEVGAQRVRRRTFSRLDRVSMAWRFSDAEFDAFRAWYEGLAVSLAGASDTLAAWTLSNATVSVGASLSSDLVAVDRLLETVTTGAHRASQNLPGAAFDNVSVLCRATIRAAGRTKARLTLLDRTATTLSVDVDLSAGTLSGLISATISDRGNGWWRVTIIATSGTGASVPVMRINALDPSGAASYAGDVTKGLDICELQARLVTGYDLFVPADTDGTGLGPSGGSAWYWTSIANGGGLNWAEARFTGPYKAVAASGLNWSVTAEVEVRDA